MRLREKIMKNILKMNKATVLILFLFAVILISTNLLSYSYGSNSFTLTQDSKIVVTDKERLQGKTRYRMETGDRTFGYQFFYEDPNPFRLSVGDTLTSIKSCK